MKNAYIRTFLLLAALAMIAALIGGYTTLIARR